MLNFIKDHWSMFRRDPIAIAMVIAFAIIIALIFLVPRPEPEVRTEVKTVEDTVSKQKLTESLKREESLKYQLSVAEKTISELKVHTTEHVRIIYKKDGTTVVDKKTTTDVDKTIDKALNTVENKELNKTIVDKKAVETETKTHVETKTVTISLPKDKFYAGISGTVGITGISNPGLEFKYRLLDLGRISVWTGGEVFSDIPTNPLNVQFRLGAGISF